MNVLLVSGLGILFIFLLISLYIKTSTVVVRTVTMAFESVILFLLALATFQPILARSMKKNLSFAIAIGIGIVALIIYQILLNWLYKKHRGLAKALLLLMSFLGAFYGLEILYTLIIMFLFPFGQHVELVNHTFPLFKVQIINYVIHYALVAFLAYGIWNARVSKMDNKYTDYEIAPDELIKEVE